MKLDFFVLSSTAMLHFSALYRLQARGWRDPRHFHKLIWELHIPEFDGTLGLHRELAAAGGEAEGTADAVVLPDGDYRRKRRVIRDALTRTGLAARMEALVGRLLNA
jgi:hypothetical protein